MGSPNFLFVLLTLLIATSFVKANGNLFYELEESDEFKIVLTQSNVFDTCLACPRPTGISVLQH